MGTDDPTGLINKGFETIKSLGEGINEKKPSSNILIYSVIIIIAFLILAIIGGHLNEILILLTFAVLTIVLYILYKLVTLKIEVTNRIENRRRYNHVYQQTIA